MKIRIGLTFTGKDDKHENYVEWIQAGDPDIEVIRLAADEGIDGLDDWDGLVLSGGVDVDPAYYSGSTDYVKAPSKWQPERDDFELGVLRLAQEKGLPVIGVCRGLQLLNVAMGGTLVQDLGVAGDETHENVMGEDKEHSVVVESGSLLAEIARASKGIANSAHHQAIDRLGKGLRVNCRAEDGTIEGIEWQEPAGKPFLLAVQWHPERMYTDGMADGFLYRNIRDRFISEIQTIKHANH